VDADRFSKLAETRIEEMKKNKSFTKEDLMNDEALRAILRRRIKTIERRTGLWELLIAIGGLASFAVVYFLLLMYYPNIPFVVVPIGWFLFLFALFSKSIKKVFTGKPDGR
jgi:hypothetical protein